MVLFLAFYLAIGWTIAAIAACFADRLNHEIKTTWMFIWALAWPYAIYRVLKGGFEEDA